QLDRLGDPFVGRDAGAAHVLKPAQHVVVPPRREGQARPRGVALAIPLDHLARRTPPEEPALEEVLLPVDPGRGDLRPAPARSSASRASSTQIVVLNDDRVDPLADSQFQPPSGSCSASSRSTMPRTSWPK